MVEIKSFSVFRRFWKLMDPKSTEDLSVLPVHIMRVCCIGISWRAREITICPESSSLKADDVDWRKDLGKTMVVGENEFDVPTFYSDGAKLKWATSESHTTAPSFEIPTAGEGTHLTKPPMIQGNLQHMPEFS